MENNKQQWSWFPSCEQCSGIFDNKEEAIADAQDRWDNEYEEFEYRNDPEAQVSPMIYVGPITWFNWKYAATQIAENIENTIDNGYMWDFAGGCDYESEVYVPKSKREEFINKVTEAIQPIIEEYVFVNPEWVCRPTDIYNLETKEWKSIKK